jgi:hypothetical protein
LELVCVYAREDEQYFRRLQRHLYPWVRQQKVAWLDISAGEEIGATMHRHLQRAAAILLLLSPDFLAEDATYDAMLTAIAENTRRKVPVVPVLARPSAWKDCECGDFQPLPEEERPLISWGEHLDEAYENIRQGLQRVLPALQVKAKVLETSITVPPLATDFRARDLPGAYVARTALLARLKRELLGAGTGQTTAITTALRGAGGFGKTTLALALCHDPEIQTAFPDGVLWIELGEQPPRPLDLLNSLLARLAGAGNTALTLEEAQEHWQAALANKTCLLVIDDVWQGEALTPLLEGGPRCQRLITTRNDRVLPPTASRVIVDAMEPAEALKLLCQGLPTEIRRPDAQTALLLLIKRLGYRPYLLTLARGLLATHLSYGRPLQEALVVVEQVYQDGSGVSWQQGHASGFDEAVEASMQASLRQLQRVISSSYQPLERFQELATFPEDTDIPIAILRLFWQVTTGLKGWEVDHLCMQLHSLSLVLTCDLGADTIRLHDVTRTYLVKRADNQLPQLHARFLDALRQKIQRMIQMHDLSEGPPTDRYLWQHLLFHLCQAQSWSEVAETLADLRFLVAKAHVCGVTELEGDLALVAKELLQVNQQEGNSAQQDLSFLPEVQQQMGRISHLLRQSTALVEMGSIVLSYLGWEEPFAEHRHLLEQALPRPYLTTWYAFRERSSSALLRTLSGHTDWVNSCAVSPDGRFIVSTSTDHTLKLWNISSSQCILTFHMGGLLYECAFHPDGEHLVACGALGVYFLRLVE